MSKPKKKPITYDEEFVIRMKEALNQKMMRLRAIDADDHLYRTSASNTSFMPNYLYNHREMLQVCASLYDMNPVATWYIDFLADMILGEGVLFSSKNERVEQVLQEFWEHPINKMDIFSQQITRELFIFGELCMPVYTSEQMTKVFLGYVNPLDIKKVKIDPQNIRIAIQIVCNSYDGTGSYKEKIMNTVLHEEEELYLSDKAKTIRSKTKEQCFYFSNNNFIGEQRGKSELYNIADHLDKNEQFMFTLMERIPNQLNFFWDVEIEGATDSFLRNWAKNNPTPSSGMQRVHNEKVKYKSMTPDTKATDMDTVSRIFRNHILGSKSIPAFYFGDGADANKATSENMSLPSIKAIKRKQSFVSHIFDCLFTFVIKTAVKSGRLGQMEDLDYSINLIEVNPKNNKEAADILSIVTKSLYDAQLSGWIQKTEASMVFSNFVKSLGYDGDITPNVKSEEK